MPRPQSSSQADIDERHALTGLGEEPPPVVTDKRPIRQGDPPLNGVPAEMRHAARGWNFNASIELLNIQNAGARIRCQDELIFICAQCKLELMAESQETPGRAEAAEKKARRRMKQGRPDPDIPASAWQAAARGNISHGVRRGRPKSWALRNTVQRLQVLAGQWNEGMVWKDGFVPSRLIDFLVRALHAAGDQIS